MTDIFKLWISAYWSFLAEHTGWGVVLTLAGLVFVYEFTALFLRGQLATGSRALVARVQSLEQRDLELRGIIADYQAALNKAIEALERRVAKEALKKADLPQKPSDRFDRLLSEDD